ncbi:MAG: MFS transporter [Chloroflexota bacterium]|nr:MFS transporter [Chloroflexota bacterium]
MASVDGFGLAYQAYLPTIVEREQLVAGKSKLEVSRSLAQIGGPGLSGVLVQLISAPLTIVLDALSYVASALFLVTIRAPELPSSGTVGRAGIWREIGEGLAVVWHDPLLRPIAACTATWNLFSAVVSALLILYATRELGIEPALLGLAIGVGSAGALLAALFAARLSERCGPGPVIATAATVGAAAYLWIPVAASWPMLAAPILGAAQAVGSFAGTTYNVTQLSLRQAIVPERLQGRMNATMRFTVWGTIPLGALLGGSLGEVVGLRTKLIGAALGCLVAPLWVILSPVRTLREQPGTMPTRP